jgi:tetratricopeptide (TPR) repeat protein
MKLLSLALAAALAAAAPGLAAAQSAAGAAPAQDAAARVAAAKAEAARAEAQAAFLRAAGQAIAHGKRGDAEALARARGDRDEGGAAVLARLAADRGDYEAAAALAAPASAASPSGEAALQWGLILFEQGKKSEARRVLAPVATGARSAAGSDGLVRVARAARALGQVRTANGLLREAVAAAGKDAVLLAAANTAWGELFLDVRDRESIANAVASFRAALTADASWAPAHAGLARALARENPPAAAAAAARAVEIDPALTAAHVFLARAALDGDRTGDARGHLARALAANPASAEAFAYTAAIEYVAGRTVAYEAAVAKALAINPVYGGLYRIVASQAASNYRYDDAVALARKAVALESDSPAAHADLGLHLLRVGDESGARRSLETAFRADGYDLVTYNLLEMLDKLDAFESIDAGGVTVRLDPNEAPAMRHYAVPLVKEAMAQMSRRYGFNPQGPIFVEIFPSHDDFAVRTLGLPGLLGALGACFGRVVTLDSPRARPPGSFNWQATLWHEMAHVFTMQLSGYRVPRWLTEGISVYEEGLRRPEWARDSELAFAKAWADRKVLTLADLNAGFTRPDTIELAYFQASLVVALIAKQHGHAALPAMLRAFADGADTDAALRRATGRGTADLQREFDAMLTERYAAVGKALHAPDGLEMPRGGDAAAIRAMAAKHAGSYPVQMAAGQALVAAGARDEAIAAFERAAALVPSAVGASSPRAQIAALAERAGDFPRALRELKALVGDDHTNIDAAQRLVPLAKRLGDQAALALAYDRIVTLDPFDATTHSAYGRLALASRDLALAVREFRAAVAAGPVDPVPAQCDLAEALLESGERAEAKQAVLAALEAAPTYERAQQLLLRIVEGR